MAAHPPLPSDRQLVAATRAGNDDAWRELVLRHEPATRAVLAARGRSARRNTNDALDELHRTLRNQPDPPEGEPAVRPVRPRVLAGLAASDYGPTGDGVTADCALLADGTIGIDDLELLARAFARLPEPWQTVLWHRHVELGSAAEVSPLVGRAVNEIGELQVTAERGLFDGFVREHLASRAATGELDDEERAVSSLVGGWVRHTLPPVDARRVDAALERTDLPWHRHVARLVAIAEELDDLVAPAVAPRLTGLTVDRHRAALGTTGRAFGTATLFAARNARERRLALVATAVVVVIALLGAAFLIRRPFADDQPRATDPSSVPTTSSAGDPTTSDPDTTGTTSDPGTSTTLDLRPDPTAPANEVELVVTTGTRPLGLRSVAPELSVAVSAPAPVLAGGTGTVDVDVTNSTAADVAASIELVVPSGIVVADVLGGAECADPPDDSPFCNLDVPADGQVRVTVRLGLESRITGRLVVDGDLVTDPLDVAIGATRHLVHNSVEHGELVVVGNTLMSCADATPGCADIRAGRGDVVDRWDVDMTFVDAAPDLGLGNSSSATVEVAPGAEVVAAYLLWSGDLKQGDVELPDDGSAGVVTLVSPAGSTRVEADSFRRGDVDATQYLAVADVTSAVVAGGGGDYVVGDVVSAEARGSYAGWSLAVVVRDEERPRRHLLVTSPFQWVSPEPELVYDVDLPVPVGTDLSARLSVVAFEGDRSFVPEALSVGGRRIGGDSMFDSSIVGDRDPEFDNNLGVDLDEYDLVIDAPSGTLPFSMSSSFDGIRLAALGLAVDVEP